MIEPTRVLWLSKGLDRGGTETLLANSASHIDRARFDVEVAYLLPQRTAMVDDIRGTNTRVHCLQQRNGADLSWALRLRRLVRYRRIDILHTHMPLPAAVARVVLRDLPTVLVHTEHNTWESYRRPTRTVNSLTFGRNAAVIAVSAAVRDSIVQTRKDPTPVHLVYHGINYAAARRGEQARREARAHLGLRDDGFVIGTVGNFRVEKDQATLISAFRMMKQDHPDAQLLLVGLGQLEPALRAQVTAFNLHGSVHFVGARANVFELLPAFDLFALSSVYEGLGIALVEALASGLPCVATSVGGVPEVFSDGVEGLLVPPRDPAALAAAMSKMADNPEIRAEMGAAAAQRARAFDVRHAVRRMEQIYDEVLTTR